MIEITQPTENQLTLCVRLSGYEMIFNSIAIIFFVILGTYQTGEIVPYLIILAFVTLLYMLFYTDTMTVIDRTSRSFLIKKRYLLREEVLEYSFGEIKKISLDSGKDSEGDIFYQILVTLRSGKQILLIDQNSNEENVRMALNRIQEFINGELSYDGTFQEKR